MTTDLEHADSERCARVSCRLGWWTRRGEFRCFTDVEIKRGVLVATSLEAMRSELNAAMTGNAPGRDAADALCGTCVGLFEVDGAAVSLVLEGASSGTFGSSSALSRRLDEYQFTFGEGPCLDAVASRESVLVPNLNSPREQRWPIYRGALLEDGIHSVFAVPILITSVCVGALDLFRESPGPLSTDALNGALLAAELASAPLLDMIAASKDINDLDQGPTAAGHAAGDPLADLDRVEVHQATGMLISALDVNPVEALIRLRTHAMSTGLTASEVARAIIDRKLMLERDDPRDPIGPGDSGDTGDNNGGSDGRGDQDDEDDQGGAGRSPR